MNEKEHLRWAKDRAIEISKTGDQTGAYASFVSDMKKHELLADHPALPIGLMQLAMGGLSTTAEMINFIEGFN